MELDNSKKKIIISLTYAETIMLLIIGFLFLSVGGLIIFLDIISLLTPYANKVFYYITLSFIALITFTFCSLILKQLFKKKDKNKMFYTIDEMKKLEEVK